MQQDKRQSRRFEVRSRGLMGLVDDAQLVSIVDMSIGGISLMAEKRLANGREHTMRIYDQGCRLDVQGTVIRSRIADSSRTLRGNRVPVYAAVLKVREGLEDRVADFICDALLM